MIGGTVSGVELVGVGFISQLERFIIFFFYNMKIYEVGMKEKKKSNLLHNLVLRVSANSIVER